MNFESENVTKKHLIQSHIYVHVDPVHTQAKMLLGNHPDHNLWLINTYALDNTKQNVIYGYELNDLPVIRQDNLEMIRGDIYNSLPTSFIDLDLCKTFKSNKELIHKLFTEQRAKRYPASVFMLTLSTRGCSQEETIAELSIMLQRNLVWYKQKYKHNKTVNITELIFTPLNKYMIRAYAYSNMHGDMISILIKY